MMLSDAGRLTAFREAIRSTIEPGHRVLDVGTGTGVLLSYAASRMPSQLTGIEVNPSLASAARSALGQIPNVDIFEGLSFDYSADRPPDVVLCELIGPLGLEERIVEVCGDIKRRLGGNPIFIPSEIQLYVVAVDSPALDRTLTRRITELTKNAFAGYRPEPIVDLFLAELSTTPFLGSTASVVGAPMVAQKYVLGHDTHSTLHRTLDFQPGRPFTYVNVYFQARLSDDIVLSNCVTDPINHWGRWFLRRPEGKSGFVFSFDRRNVTFRANWY